MWEFKIIFLSWLKVKNIEIYRFLAIFYTIYANYANEERLHDCTMVRDEFLDLINMDLDSQITFLS